MTDAELPPEWWGDSFKAWTVLDSQRQDDELKRQAGEIAVLKEKLEGKAKQDIDAAHKSIRVLFLELAKERGRIWNREWQDVALMALVAIICIILVLLAATFIPSVRLVH